MSAAVGAAGLAAVAVIGIVGRAGWPLRHPVVRPVTPVAPSPRQAWRRRRPPAGDLVIAEWCEQAARSLRGGASLSRAIGDASAATPAAATAFAPALHALGRGRGLPGAIATLSADPSTPVGLVVPVLQACAELGGPAAVPLERTAAVLHGRAAEDAERRTASAQARLSARVLTLLPIGTLGVLVLAEDATRDALSTPAGIACATAGGVCNVTGWWWMRRIIGAAR
jgi:tight adherence protein B